VPAQSKSKRVVAKLETRLDRLEEMLDDRKHEKPYEFTFNSDAQALAHFSTHRIVLLGGGVGSGKTVLHGLDALKRSKNETDVLHGLFTNTQSQLEKKVVPDIQTRFAMAGFETPVFDRRPPLSWVRRWVREGIEIPPIARYRNILTAPTGYHAIAGTLHNQSFHQFESIELGSARIEEAINNSLVAINTIFERVRCGTGGGERCAARHHHQRYLIFNPPLGPHPWLYSFLDQMEETAKAYYHELDEGQLCGCSRVHGPALSHREWPLLRRGIGPAVWYQSRTSDNAANLDAGYRDGLAMNYSKDTARRRLDGEIIRETAGRAYTEFTTDNVRRVAYDPNRTLYLGLDFNSEPRAAVLAHPLNPGEYPSDFNRKGVTHLGVFGEFFWGDKLSDRKFAEKLVNGDRGFGGDSQPRYRDEDLRGLPENWRGLKGHQTKIVAFGDATGGHRSSHSDNLESSWQIVDQVFRQLVGKFSKNVDDSRNPPARARVDSVNGKFLNMLDIRSLWIDPRCEELIRDFEQVMWDEDGGLREWRRGSLGTEWHRTHLSDALGYIIHRLFPLGRELGDGSQDINGALGAFARRDFKEPRM
jgi:hypothetical protein